MREYLAVLERIVRTTPTPALSDAAVRALLDPRAAALAHATRVLAGRGWAPEALRTKVVLLVALFPLLSPEKLARFLYGASTTDLRTRARALCSWLERQGVLRRPSLARWELVEENT